MQKSIRRRWPVIALAAIAVAAVTAGVARKVMASDHQDSPLVENNPRYDVNDVYAFPSPNDPSKTVLVLGTQSPLTPANTRSATFGTRDQVVYQLKIDNTGDAKEDRVIQVIFKGTGASQTVEVRGPLVPPVVGAMGNKLADDAPVITGNINTVLGTASGMQVYAGAREDPFYLDLEQFFRIVPDRKPSTGAFSLLPDTPSAGTFRTTAAAVDYLKGFNTMSIIVEVPTSQVTAGGGPKIGTWGTTSR
jgi:Domain of unknown function (DUF4331)